MKNFMDGLENAAQKLQEFGKKALPVIQENFDKAFDTAQDAYEKAKPGMKETFDKVVSETKQAFDKASPIIEDGFERAIGGLKVVYQQTADNLRRTDKEEGDVPEAPTADVQDIEEEINEDVDALMDKIRAARSTPGAFSDYVSEKYGKNEK